MKREKDRIVSVRLAAQDYVIVRGAAIATGKRLSEFIRSAAVDRALEPKQQKQEAS